MPRPLAVALLLAVLATAPAHAAGRERVLVSADMAAGLAGQPPDAPYPSDVDDGIAIALALNAEGLDVDGIAVTFGNNDAEPETRQTRVLVHDVMGRRDVPIAQGAVGPLPPAPPAGAPDPCVNDGVRLLAEQLARPARLLALGPLTDVACLVRAFPARARNVTEILAQVGARPGEPYDLNGRPVLFSLNVSADPQAARDVYATPVLGATTITSAPYHITISALLDDARLDRLGGERPEGRWLREQMVAFRAFWKAALGDDGLRPWDQNLVHFLIRPDDFVEREVGWRIVDCSDPTGRNAGPACAGHGPTQFPTRDGEAAQLWLGLGEGQALRPRTRILDRYASDAAETRFLDTIADLRAASTEAEQLRLERRCTRRGALRVGLAGDVVPAASVSFKLDRRRVALDRGAPFAATVSRRTLRRHRRAARLRAVVSFRDAARPRQIVAVRRPRCGRRG